MEYPLMVQGLEELDDEAVQYVYPLGGGLQIGRGFKSRENSNLERISN